AVSRVIARHYKTEMLDDPYIRWRQLEASVGIALLYFFETTTTLEILESNAPIESKILLAAAWADAGRSPYSLGRVDIQIRSTMSAASQTKLAKFSIVFS
ncbi:MAG: hypothetical protein R3C49_12105, partial [Planctomycetaceae bacterium]